MSPSIPVLRGPGQETSTEPDDVPISRLKRARLFRRLFLVLLAAFVLAGLLGFWGVKERRAGAVGDGWTIDVRYAGVTRAGLAVPLEWVVTHEGGFEETVVMRMTDDYFNLFDENSFDPTPSKEWSDGEFIYWEFDAPPDRDTFTVSTDTRTGSAVQFTAMEAELSVMVEGQPVVTVDFKTWVMP